MIMAMMGVDHSHHNVDDMDEVNEATSHHLVHNPLELDDAAATAAKLAEAGHLYGTTVVDMPVEETEV
jgi:hypothetical protein